MKCPKCRFDNAADISYCGQCGTSLLSLNNIPFTQTLQTPIKELNTGSTFAGRYQVIEELGRGGMGKVYKVFDTKTKEKVALKLIKPEIADDEETIERFRNELRLARKISHRNVCRMFDLGEAEGAHFLTMEYVPGENLKTMIRMSTGLTAGTVLSVGKQICDGLDEAHRLGVIHRDLKPQNIMIDRGGNAKIMDFGIARSIREKGITGPNVMIGTPEYMSPEQAEAKEVDHRSDIYSLGIILYEMATGRVPFEGDTPFAIFMKHKGEIPKNPAHLNPHLPDDLSRAILKCLAKDKTQRYQSAAEVRSELEKIEKEIPTAERVVPVRKTHTSREITVKFNLKKLLIPTALLMAVAVIGVIAWRLLPHKSAPPIPSGQHSLAVLPFADLSPKKDYEYLCEGIPETLITALTAIKDLRVPARASAFSFRGKEQELGEIGRKLNVDTVLRGSVQVIGDRLRITPQLIAIEDGSYLWSKTYDRKLEDVFAIQDEMAGEIVRALKIKLLGEKEAPLIKKYTENLQAYNFYLQGLFYWNKRTMENINKAIDFFRQAVEADPKYALAYVGLADCYLMLPLYGRSSTKETVLKAKAAIAKALDIDDQLAEAHASLAKIKEWDEWDWDGAKKEYRRSMELNPNYATAHHWYAIALTFTGQLDKAMAETRRSIELDPLSLYMKATLGDELYGKGDFDQAIRQYLSVLEIDPTFVDARLQLGACYREKGLLTQAIAEVERAAGILGKNPYALGALGHIYALAGNRAKAMDILADLMRLSKQGYSLNYDMALIYCGLGDKSKAFDKLEQARQEKEIMIRYLKFDPTWKGYRTDPRFQSLLKEMNLE